MTTTSGGAGTAGLSTHRSGRRDGRRRRQDAAATYERGVTVNPDRQREESPGAAARVTQPAAS